MKKPMLYIIENGNSYFSYEDRLQPLFVERGYDVYPRFDYRSMQEPVMDLQLPEQKRWTLRAQQLEAQVSEYTVRAIRKSDIIVAILSEIHSGIGASIGFAAGLGKRVECCLLQFNPQADLERGRTAPRISHMVQESGGNISSSLDDLLEKLELYKTSYNDVQEAVMRSFCK